MPTKNRIDRVSGWYHGAITGAEGWVTPSTFSETLGVDQNVYSARSPNLPKWRDKIENGENCSTTLQAISVLSNKNTPGQMRAKQLVSADQWAVWDFGGQVHTPRLTGRAYNFSFCSAEVIDRAKSLAEVRFAKAYQRKVKSFSGGEFVGELKETARQIKQPGKALRDQVDVLKIKMARATKIARRNAKYIAKLERRLENATLKYQKRHISRLLIKAKKDPFTIPKALYEKYRLGDMNYSARAVAGTYLEWCFGVKPIIKAADEIALASQRLAVGGRGFDIWRVYATATDAEVISNTLIQMESYPGYPTLARCYELEWDRAEVTIRGAWRSDTPTGEIAPLPVFGLDLYDLVPTVWDLTPLSVFIDYFTNIGDTLDAWSLRLVNFAWVNETTRSSRIVQWNEPIAVENFDVYTYEASGGQAELKFGSVTRLPKDGEWSTDLRLKVPNMDEHHKWLRLAAFGVLRYL